MITDRVLKVLEYEELGRVPRDEQLPGMPIITLSSVKPTYVMIHMEG